EQDPAVLPAFEWLQKQLGKLGLSIEGIVHEEHSRQAAAQVTVGNIITSMRLLSTLDWKDFFETVSLIDPELAKDPAAVYSKMDFTTRDRYRHVIERLSKRAKIDEIEVARTVLRLAESTPTENEDAAEAHVGYFLIDKGLSRLEHKIGYRPSLREKLLRFLERHASAIYLDAIALVTFFIAMLIFIATFLGHGSIVMAVVAAILSVFPASDLVITVVLWAISHFSRLTLLPKIRLSVGCYPDGRTMVVVRVT